MSTPIYGGYPSYGNDPQGGAYQGQELYGAQPYAPYPSAYPQYDLPSGALTDGTYGDGHQTHPMNNPAANGWYHTKGTGKLRLGQAISWAVKAMVANPAIILLLGLVPTALNAVTQLPWVGVLAFVALILVYPVLVAVSLQQTLATKFQTVEAPAYGKTLGMCGVLILVTIGGLLFISLIALLLAVAGFDVDAVASGSITDDEVLNLLLIYGGVIGLLTLVVAPFVVFPVNYAADNNGSIGQALSSGMGAGARNYLQTVGLILVISILTFIAESPAVLIGDGTGFNALGFAIASILSIIVTPFTYLVLAHAYRQVSGGPVPHEA